MEILKTKIEDILKFPFKEKDWVSTFGVYALINFVSSLIIGFAAVFIFFAISLVLEEFDTLMLTLIGVFSFFFFAIYFLVYLYLQGYIVELVKNIKEEKEKLPKHKDLKGKMRQGIDYFLLGLGPIVFSIAVLAFSITLILLGTSNLETSEALGIILIIAGIFSSFLSILITLFVTIMVIPSMLYIYIDTGAVSKAYCFKKVKIIVKKMWKEFSIIYLVSLVMSMIVSSLGQMPCIGFIIMILGTIYIVFITSFLKGKVFAEIDKLKILEK